MIILGKVIKINPNYKQKSDPVFEKFFRHINMHDFFLWYDKNQFILTNQETEESASLDAITKILNKPYPELSYHHIVIPQILRKINS